MQYRVRGYLADAGYRAGVDRADVVEDGEVDQPLRQPGLQLHLVSLQQVDLDIANLFDIATQHFRHEERAEGFKAANTEDLRDTV